ncbi:hypothetical protein ZIOFF_050297 [Zingiber officinale]|uniref:Uncharacterized protein n=1 Tax=Zingiber officinale TaxID=94328 RepID=A0A8J5G0A9_ZINOF|nr:hypothetical protein ZIOFF_050297 [Zingiber officinale]
MDPIILESPSPVKSLAEGPLAGTIFDSMLKESIDRFLIEVKESYIILRLLLLKPPMPIIILLLFEDDILDLVMFKESHACDNTTKFDSRTNKRDDDLFFFDNKGRVEPAKDDDMETAEAAFLTAAYSMKSDVSKKRRKQTGHASKAKNNLNCS